MTVETGEGTSGLAAHAPYDVIMVSGGLPAVTEALRTQLKVGGRLFGIVGQAPAMVAQKITRLAEDRYETRNLFETVAPLIRDEAGGGGFAF